MRDQIQKEQAFEGERERPCHIGNIGNQCKNEHEWIQALKNYNAKSLQQLEQSLQYIEDIV